MRLPANPFLGLVLAFLAGTAHATVGVDFQLQLGNPSNATSDETNPRSHLSQRPQYALDYNNTTREPNWVSWHLTLPDLGSSGRGDFAVDETLPAGFHRVLTTDYSGSGYDRGHVCPSGDRTATVADNQVTFYMSNLVPQSPDNNQGVWASFESYCRSLASLGNEILLISGPSGFLGTTLASGVAIPGYVWKIALVVPAGPGSALSRIHSATRVIALKIPNIAGIRSNPWQQYTTSVAQLETDTGYAFFPRLPASVAAALRLTVEDQSATGTPRLTTQPAAQSAALGGTATFAVTATGNAPLTFQWSLDGEEITGATTATLSVTNVQVSRVGLYSVVVTNSLGSVTSATAPLSLGPPSAAGVLSWDFATAAPTRGLPAGITGGIVTQCNNNGTTQLLTSVSVAGGYSGVSGGNNAGAAARIGPLTRTPTTGSAYFEFTLTPEAGRQLVVSSLSFGARSTATGPQAFALFTSVDDFATPVATGPLANNSGWTLLTPTLAAFAGVPGTAITFQLYGYNGAGNAGTGTANWRIDDLQVGVSGVANSATPPVITRQPGPATVIVGGTATLSVAATGSPAPVFQWRQNGLALPGATGDTLTLTAATLTQAGSYTVVVSNSAASVTTPAATLHVIRRSYAGYYFGLLGDRGAFALHLRADNTGAFLGFTPDSSTGWVSRAVAVSDDGALRLIATAFRGTAPAGDLTLTGNIADNGQLAATAAPDTAFSLRGLKTIVTGSALPQAGFYTAGTAARADTLYAIVSDSGRALIATTTGAFLEYRNAARDDAGNVVFTDPVAHVSVNATTSVLAARVTRSGQAATVETYAGAPIDSAPSSAQRVTNLSTRTRAGTGDQVAIAGFVVTGLESKPVLIRAVGPALRQFDVTTALGAPRLELRRGANVIATNAGWDSAPNAVEIAATTSLFGAFPLAAGGADSAILTTLAPGAYTAVASAADSQPGIVLVEIYDLDRKSDAPRLANLSTRALTGSGDNTLLLGLFVSGNLPKRVLIRAAGPALGAFGVSGFLARPELTVFSGSTALAANSGWSTSPDAPAIAEASARTGAFTFGATSFDAALIIHLAPGAYTAQVSGPGGAAGIVLLEIYEVP